MIVEKTEQIFQEVKRISDASFFGVERPPELALRYHYDHCELFTTGYGVLTMAYAMITIDGGQPFIWSLATDPALRKNGLATKLLQEIIHHYSKNPGAYPNRIDLTVNVDNSAQKLYFDFGWRALKVIPRYYGEMSGLRMRRVL